MDRRRGGGGGRGGSGRGRGRGGFGGGGGRGGGFGGRGGGFGGRGGGRGRGRGGRGGGRGGGPDSRGSTRRREEAEVSELVARIEAEVPEAGTQETIGKDFTDLPICGYTIAALTKHKFKRMTQIQRVAIPHGLAGRDVLGAAKTGSGKTLAFLVPVVEALFRARWSREDGIGALVISPTRELALQIFEVLRQVLGNHYGLTAGFVTGGKNFYDEQEHIAGINIIVCTPGRIVQHLEQTPAFDLSSLKVLVLDEADRLLDMGFSDELNTIVSSLPPPGDRQTLLFSATQTKSVRDLARLNLQDPCYVAVHEKAQFATPAQLTQHYMVCHLPDKMNMLYSFVKTHLRQKTIVFVSSCKQARFMFEAFRRLRPGLPVSVLHGKQKQKKRMVIYYDFCDKPSALMFATDVAARGLDFPQVDWVVQLDCPDSTEMYIHRVGRTARFKKKGKSLLILLPSEAPKMTQLLSDAKVPLTQISVNPSRAISVTAKLASNVAADPDLKYLAQRAFASYVRSIYLQPNKEVFDITALPLDDFAASIGLATAPQVKVLKESATWDTQRKEKNKNKKLQRLKASIAAAKKAKQEAAAAARRGEHGGDDDDSSDYSADSQVLAPTDESSSEDDILVPKSAGADGGLEEAGAGDLLEGVEHLGRRERARVERITAETQAAAKGQRGEDGLTPFERLALEIARKERGAVAPSGDGDEAPAAVEVTDPKKYHKEVRERVKQLDAADRKRDRDRVRRKHREARRKEREARGIRDDDAEDDGGVMLAPAAAAAEAADGSSADDESESSADSASSSEVSSSDDDSEPPAKRGRTIATVEDAEQLALERLRQRRATLN